MSQLQKGHTYNTGDIVDAPDLNSLVDAGIARTAGGIITDQAAIPEAVATNDQLLLYNTSMGALQKANVSALPGAGTVTSVSAVLTNGSSVFNFTIGGVPTVTPQVTLGLDPQVGNKVLASPLDGSSGTPAFRALVAADLTIPPVSVAALLIDWTLADYFVKILPNDNATRALTLQNGSVGQVIKVRVDQGAAPGGSAVLNWSASGNVLWSGGVQPVLSTGPSHRDVFEFICTGVETYFGIRWGANFL